MVQRFAGKAVLVTGAATGIGKAVAARIVEEGGRVAIGDINEAAATATVRELGEAARFVRCDVTREEDVGAMIDAVTSAFGHLDVLVNNAGTIVHRPIADVDVDLWDRVFAVNARSTFFVTKRALPHLIASGRGAIVNMSSMAGLRGAPGLSVYSASKAAVNGLTVALALEFAPHGMRVNAVCPGWVDTSFNQPVIDFFGGAEATAAQVRAGTPLGRQGTTAEIAALVAYLASDEAGFVTAQTMSINGGAYN